MKKNAITFLFILLSGLAFGQNSTDQKKAKPNLPGTFLIDLGVNRALDSPEKWKQGFWGSRAVNIYYQYPIRIGRSKFSFNPGLGISLERWKFTNGVTLIDTVELVSFPNGAAAAVQVEQYNLLSPKRIYPELAGKSQLITNYFEIPVEFRFDTSPEDINRSFNVAIGGRVGYLFDSFTKVKYKDGNINEDVKVKNKMNYGVREIRYGIYTRIGLGGFSLFCFYNLSDMFQTGKGPTGTTMNTITTGISINGF